MKRTSELKRKSAMPRKAKAKRTWKSPRCGVRGCTRAEIVDGLCYQHARDQADAWCRSLARQTITECARCGGTEMLQWSHHLSRRFMEIRWTPSNYTIHCSGCHKWLTENPAAHTEWIIAHIGARHYALLMDAAYGAIDPHTGTRTGPPKFTHQDMADAYLSLRKAAA